MPWIDAIPPDRSLSASTASLGAGTALWGAWNRGVSASTVAARGDDLRLFGRFSWRCSGRASVSRTVTRILADLRDGGEGIAALARAWDDAQRSDGVSLASRRRRRSTLRSVIAFAVAHRKIFRVPICEPVDRLRADPKPRGPIHERVESEIVTALARGQTRDAAIVALAWESGLSLARIAALQVRDLGAPVLADLSLRCAAALAEIAGARPRDAWLFPSRDMSRPLAAKSVAAVLDRRGLPTSASLRVARARRLRDITGHDDPPRAARVLAAESDAP